MRLLHLGLGNFFRAHQAWYTAHCADSGDWDYAAFSGRSAALAEALQRQHGRYTLITRGPQRDAFETIDSVRQVHAPSEHDAWLEYFRSPALTAVTTTVTEAGYARGDHGGLDLDRPGIRADLSALQRDPAALVGTVPARLVAGLLARYRAGGGPLSLVPCDNLPGNGRSLARVIGEFAQALDGELAGWLASSVSYVSTTVDRITPRATDAEADAVQHATGVRDCCPVVTEPFSEWVLCGDFPAGRPEWDTSGAVFTDDIEPFERRKLWLLNGAHSLLAYAGSVRGAATVAEAIADDISRGWVQQWWSEASPHLPAAADADAYTHALLERFANPRIRHLLGQIAADGSQKLPVRVLPVLRAERAAGRLPEGACRILGAWILHLRGGGVPVDDVHADVLKPLAAGRMPDAVRRVLAHLDPALPDDGDLITAVTAAAQAAAN